MPPRRRIAVYGDRSGSGGGPPPTTGNVAWGPDFGESPELTVGVQHSFADLALANTQTVGVSQTGDLAFGNTKTVGVAPTFVDLALANTKTVGVDVSSLSYTVSARLAVADTWVPNVALCPDDTNKNGTNLQFEGPVATRKRAFMAFDLSQYPSNATVTAAQLIVNVTSAPVADSGFNVGDIEDADEGWTEAGMICSNVPTPTSVTANVVAVFAAGATGERSINLGGDPNWLTRISNRMGQTVTVTIGTAINTELNTQIQSKDSGGSPGNAFGPRLELTFTVPV